MAWAHHHGLEPDVSHPVEEERHYSAYREISLYLRETKPKGYIANVDYEMRPTDYPEGEYILVWRVHYGPPNYTFPPDVTGKSRRMYFEGMEDLQEFEWTKSLELRVVIDSCDGDYAFKYKHLIRPKIRL